jgi:hypothetical protein
MVNAGIADRRLRIADWIDDWGLPIDGFDANRQSPIANQIGSQQSNPQSKISNPQSTACS